MSKTPAPQVTVYGAGPAIGGGGGGPVVRHSMNCVTIDSTGLEVNSERWLMFHILKELRALIQTVDAALAKVGEK